MDNKREIMIAKGEMTSAESQKPKENSREEKLKTRVEISQRSLAGFSKEDVEKTRGILIKSIMGFVRGEAPLRGQFSDEEKKLLSKMSAEVRQKMRENPQADINLDFSKNQEAYVIWTELLNRITNESLNTKKRAQEQARLEELRDSIDKHEAPKKQADPRQAEAEGIRVAFGKIPESVVRAKISEYDGRIRRALAGEPLKPGETIGELYRGFRYFAKKDWTRDLDTEEQKEN
ncbi:MAG: hypothetical protein Q8P97_00690 [bacterium]|nr:hypothetical protein [bacterium]